MIVTLKAARINAGLTQKEVADALNINKNTIASYENYKTKPDIVTAERLAKLYGATVNDIIFYKQIVL